MSSSRPPLPFFADFVFLPRLDEDEEEEGARRFEPLDPDAPLADGKGINLTANSCDFSTSSMQLSSGSVMAPACGRTPSQQAFLPLAAKSGDLLP